MLGTIPDRHRRPRILMRKFFVDENWKTGGLYQHLWRARDEYIPVGKRVFWSRKRRRACPRLWTCFQRFVDFTRMDSSCRLQQRTNHKSYFFNNGPDCKSIIVGSRTV